MKKIYLSMALSLFALVSEAQCVVQVAGTNVSCNGLCDGTATATPVGVPSYSYLWQPGNMNTATVTGLCPGTYTVTVVDGAACTSTASIVITEPTALSATATSTDPSCNGDCSGAATAFVSGGTSPYTHNWSTPTAQTTANATGLCAGIYNDTISDANGCTTLLTNVVTITDPPVLNASVIVSGVSCFGGSDGMAIALQTGGTPGYTYSWSTTPVETNDTISNLSPGTYTVTITDNNGCTATANGTVNQPSAALSVTSSTSVASCGSCCDATGTSTASGGTGAYTYLWTPGSLTTQNVSNLCPGNYTVCVTDANGCSVCDNGTVNFTSGINEISANELNVYPNPVSSDLTVEMKLTTSLGVKFSVLDVLGKEVFSETVTASGDFKKKISLSGFPNGIYYLKAEMNGNTLRKKIILSQE